jgi:hypothetical protein
VLPLKLASHLAPSLRVSAASMANTFAKLIGFTLGPLAVGFVSDLAHRDLGLSLLLLTPTGLLLAAACLGTAVAVVKRDVIAMEESWAHRGTSAGSLRCIRPEAEQAEATAHP